jgi:hypothetical protein
MTLSSLAQQFAVNSSWCRHFQINTIWSSQPLVSSCDYEIIYLGHKLLIFESQTPTSDRNFP